MDPRRMRRRRKLKRFRRGREHERRSRHPRRAEDVTLDDVFVAHPIHLLKGGARKDGVRVAVLVPANAIPRLDQRQKILHSGGRRTSVLVSREIGRASCREGGWMWRA